MTMCRVLRPACRAAIVLALACSGAAAAATEDEAARRFYASGGDVPAWSAPADAHAALALLDGAADEGLEPADYGAAALRDALERRSLDGGADAGFDMALTVAMLRYVADLRCGRSRGAMPSYLPGRENNCDAATLLRAALDGRRLGALPVDAAPALAVYARLRAALQHYRARAAGGDTVVGRSGGPAGSPAGDPVEAAAPALWHRLAELGDLAPGEAPAQAGTLAAALKRFQHRHGLREDGILGPATLAALDVPLRQRARQIALAMERLRWLPPLPERRLVAINLPSYRLWAFDRALHGAEPVLDMRVIVGRAVRTPTPLFVGSMRSLEFNPYWNVPASILRGEIVPKLLRDPAYLRRQQMEVVQGNAATQTVTPAILQGLRSGSLRVRQRPGHANALGALKFVLPNPMGIYLHGTPARELFDAARRDFSHGCIRVEFPAVLALFALGDPVAWSAAAVEAAIAQGRTRAVPLEAPVPVVIFYATAVPAIDGTMHFFDDVYGLDAALERRWAR